MAYDYDIITIGLGPAGMAVSIMGSEMGLKVCGIEKHKIGGECMNVGCIPSKALIRIAKARHIVRKYERLELSETDAAAVRKPFTRIQGDLDYISQQKTMGMFGKVDMVYQKGAASFVDRHTVEVDGRHYGDGSVRNTTPLSPAINLGAERVLAVSVREPSHVRTTATQEGAPTIAQIAGVLLDAVDEHLGMVSLVSADAHLGEQPARSGSIDAHSGHVAQRVRHHPDLARLHLFSGDDGDGAAYLARGDLDAIG